MLVTVQQQYRIKKIQNIVRINKSNNYTSNVDTDVI